MNMLGSMTFVAAFSLVINKQPTQSWTDPSTRWEPLGTSEGSVVAHAEREPRSLIVAVATGHNTCAGLAIWPSPFPVIYSSVR